VYADPSCGNYAGPRRIPLEGENGPAFTGGSSAPPATYGFAWDRHPVALAILVAFFAIVAWKVVR